VVAVKDRLPDGLIYVSDNGAGFYDPSSGIWNVGGLDVGAHSALQITATVGVEGPIANMAEVWASNLYDPDSSPHNEAVGEDDEDIVTLNAHGAADLSLTKVANPAAVVKGSHTTYTIAVTDNGPDGATGVIVRDQLPAGVTYVSSSGGKYDPKTGAWTVGSLANGHTATLKITVIVAKTGSIINTATVVASDQRDPDPANGTASAAVSANGATPPPTVAEGSTPAPQGPGSLVLWVLGIAVAGFVLIAAGARIAYTTRVKPRR
jgi:uncharacterized repeat protein (TIGR01451 family)